MAFLTFDRDEVPQAIRTTTPSLSIATNGRMGLNTIPSKALGEPKFVIPAYDPTSRKLVFTAVDKAPKGVKESALCKVNKAKNSPALSWSGAGICQWLAEKGGLGYNLKDVAPQTIDVEVDEAKKRVSCVLTKDAPKPREVKPRKSRKQKANPTPIAAVEQEPPMEDEFELAEASE